jgi:hypothetical protein
VALSEVELTAFASLVALLAGLATFGRAGEPRPWTQAVAGEPYRNQRLDVSVSVPRGVRIAVPFAWAVVGVCALRALAVPLQILAVGTTTSAVLSDCSALPCDPPRLEVTAFDSVSGALYGVHLVALLSAIGAFARWGRDAARDMDQCRRPAPLIAGGALVIVALALQILLGLRARPAVFHRSALDPAWLVSIEVAAVLLGVAMVSIARRAAPAPQAP